MVCDIVIMTTTKNDVWKQISAVIVTFKIIHGERDTLMQSFDI